MSLISFSKPSDSEILQKIAKNNRVISFVGEGSLRQNVNETFYIRTVKVQSSKEEILKNVIYIKRGTSWFFKAIENASSA